MKDEQDGKDKNAPRPVAELLPTLPKRPPARLLDAAVLIGSPDEALSVLYQHSVLCQTCLPFRDPGDETRTWERVNGSVRLKVLAGEATDPADGKFIPVGLPFGPKARLVLMHINQQALLAQTPLIEVESSLTKFVGRMLKLNTGGRTIRVIKDQLSRLSASSIRLGMVKEGRSLTVNSQIVTAFDIWFPKDERQRVLWPSTIQLSLDYWESLRTHAVPLNEIAIASLSHSAMALDLYAWLAQRLHRIEAGKSVFVPWTALQGQFGQGYARIRKFREVFLIALKQVQTVYGEARFEVSEAGMTLHHSRPPVLKRLLPLHTP